MSDSNDMPPEDAPGSPSEGGSRAVTPAIDYPGLLQNALRRVVRDVLGQVADLGLPGEHHFYISFATDHPGVGVSESLRARHPEEMTIVLQHDYRDLDVDDEGFDVTLRFGGLPQSLRIPFVALTSFFDPAVQFMLRFEPEEGEEDGAETAGEGEASGRPDAEIRRIPTQVLREADARDRPRPAAKNERVAGERAAEGKKQEKEEKEDGEADSDEGAKTQGRVVSIEAFRRK